jgi:hypothetical protein
MEHVAILDQLPFGGEPGEELVSPQDGDIEGASLERSANPPLSEVEVKRVMHPIVAVVAIQMVGPIVGIDSD